MTTDEEAALPGDGEWPGHVLGNKGQRQDGGDYASDHKATVKRISEHDPSVLAPQRHSSSLNDTQAERHN